MLLLFNSKLVESHYLLRETLSPRRLFSVESAVSNRGVIEVSKRCAHNMKFLSE